MAAEQNSKEISFSDLLASDNVRFVSGLVEGLTPPFAHDLYMEFGQPEYIKKVLMHYTNYGEICERNPKYADMNIKCYAVSGKLMRCIILELPECENEMDCAYVAVAFDYHHPCVITCERMEADNYAFCRYEDSSCDDMAYVAYENPEHHICDVVEGKPEIREMCDFVDWSIQNEAPPDVYLSIVYNAAKKRCSYINYDTSDPRSAVCLLGTGEAEIYVYEKDGVRYKIIKNWENGNFAAFRSSEDGFDHIRLEDWDTIQEHIKIWEGV